MVAESAESTDTTCRRVWARHDGYPNVSHPFPRYPQEQLLCRSGCPQVLPNRLRLDYQLGTAAGTSTPGIGTTAGEPIRRIGVAPTADRQPMAPTAHRQPMAPTAHRQPMAPTAHRQPMAPTVHRQPMAPAALDEVGMFAEPVDRALQAIFDGDLRRPAEIANRCRDVGTPDQWVVLRQRNEFDGRRGANE